MRRVESHKGRSGFTLIELLVVVAIIALLISILLPSLARARELSRRTVCASNMHGMGNALYTYAGDNSDDFPTAAHATATAVGLGLVEYQKVIGSKRGVLGNPSAGETCATTTSPVAPCTAAGSTQVSTVRNLWTLVRLGGMSPKSLICPSSEDEPNSEDNPQDYWDFGKGDNTEEKIPGSPIAQDPAANWKQVSYGYQVPYGQMGRPSSDRQQEMVLVADKGPWGAAADGLRTPAMTYPITADSLSSADDWRIWNSPNHGGYRDGEGQTCLFADGSAEFRTSPAAGVAKDNIYTRWSLTVPAVPANQRVQGDPPDASTGTSPCKQGTKCTPLGQTDSLIYP